MAELKVRQGGAWVNSGLSGKARLGGSWVDYGPADEEPVDTETLFTGAEVPDNADWTQAGTAITLGTVISPSVDGEITAGRWLFPATAPAGAVVQFVLYDNIAETELARATFTAPVWGVWNEVPIAPVAVTAGQSLVAAVYMTASSQVRYPFDADFFAATYTRGNLTAPRTGLDPKGAGNGRFRESSAGYPASSFNATCYFVDLVFAVPAVSGGSVTLVAPDRPVISGQTVGLDATATNLAGGETITAWSWSVRSGGGSLSSSTSATPTYTAPSGVGVAVVRASVTTSLGNTGFVDIKVSRAANPVAAENALPGTPRATWDLPVGALGGISTLQGFADGFSANRDETVNFKVAQSDGAGWSAQVYRLGWYGGDGARLIATLTPDAGQLAASQGQPSPGDVDPDTTLPSLDCGNWSTSLTWTPPSWAPSGMYVLRLNSAGGGASHVMFVLRDDARAADLMLMPSDSTWQAYNAFGGLGSGQYAGNSLYFGTALNQYDDDTARFISYNRPIINRGACDPGRAYGAVEWSNFFTAEFPMVRFLERNGFDVKYYSCIDAAGDPDGALLANVGAAMFVGHNEYWSDGMRSGWEAAKAAGTHVFSSAGNEVFWRLVGTDPDADGRPRTWECQKSTIGGRGDDRPEWTGAWRDPDGATKGGDQPENTFTGTIFVVNGPDMRSLVVPADGGYAETPLWRHTTVAALTAGQSWSSPGQILGFEWDTYGPEGVSSTAAAFLADPHPDAIFCSDATYSISSVLLTDAGDEYGSGTATHRLVVHPGGAGALTFGAGTVNWALGLDAANTYQQGADNTSSVLQQATVNMLVDMGATPTTLMSGLTMPTPVDWYGTTQPAGESFTLGVPTGATDASDSAITLGMKFTVTAAGSWTGVRVWVTPTVPSITPSIAAYNDDAGTRLAVKAYTEPGTRGTYHDVLFDAPVAVSAGVTYQAAVHTTRYGHSPNSSLTLPLTSSSGRLLSASSTSVLARYRYEASPGTAPPNTGSDNYMHMAPIVEFD